jgi:serine/threonine protein kinase
VARHAKGDLIDHYEIVELLGEGAYSEVYRAVDRRTGATVVLKSGDPNLFADPALFQRYRRESDCGPMSGLSPPASSAWSRPSSGSRFSCGRPFTTGAGSCPASCPASFVERR